MSAPAPSASVPAPAPAVADAFAVAVADRREHRYRSLIEGARGLLVLVTLDDIVRHLLGHVPGIMECAACSLYLPDTKTRELVIY